MKFNFLKHAIDPLSNLNGLQTAIHISSQYEDHKRAVYYLKWLSIPACQTKFISRRNPSPQPHYNAMSQRPLVTYNSVTIGGIGFREYIERPQPQQKKSTSRQRHTRSTNLLHLASYAP